MSGPATLGGRTDPAHFERRYRAVADPWGYATRSYEREKYRRTLAAAGAGPFSRALELGCSIGVFTALLAGRCDELVAVDGSPTALARAERRLALQGARDLGLERPERLDARGARRSGHGERQPAAQRPGQIAAPAARVRFERRDLPRELPAGPFDLIVASEILYYWDAALLTAALPRLEALLAPGGRLVAVHWRGDVVDGPLDGDAVHALVRARTTLRHAENGDTADYRLDVWERDAT